VKMCWVVGCKCPGSVPFLEPKLSAMCRIVVGRRSGSPGSGGHILRIGEWRRKLARVASGVVLRQSMLFPL
jgi:hypothetical protein